jgi:hypothetical protein
MAARCQGFERSIHRAQARDRFTPGDTHPNARAARFLRSGRRFAVSTITNRDPVVASRKHNSFPCTVPQGHGFFDKIGKFPNYGTNKMPIFTDSPFRIA